MIVRSEVQRQQTVASASTPAKAEIPRRPFLFWLFGGWAAFVAASMTVSAATVRFMFPNVLFEPNQTFKAGFPTEIQVGEVDEQFKQSEGIWLVRDEDRVFALVAVCTHLGCVPNWLEEEQKFKCPCHGSGCYKSGINFEGPTPRPLERAAIALADDGRIVVDKSRTFRYERGEWDRPEAYLKTSATV